MEKKTYVKPTVETVAVETNALMAASGSFDVDTGGAKDSGTGDVVMESKKHSFNVFDDDEEEE